MKRLLALLGGALGAVAWLRRRRRTVDAATEDPADELRAKLAESRSIVDEREVDEAGETPVDRAPDPAERRAEVHERARQALDELQ